jgi:GNAT superfamily N-acetyltransferase
MNIRLAKESDYEAVVRLVSELMIELGFREFDGAGVDEIFRDFIQSEARGYVMLAESNENICGVCTVSIVMALRTKGVYGIIQEMYVLPEIRGQGIGEKLLEAALEYAQSVGCRMVEVGTPPEGSRQGRFYQGGDFKRFGKYSAALCELKRTNELSPGFFLVQTEIYMCEGVVSG